MIILRYYDIRDDAPYTEGEYMVFMTDGTVKTGFWNKKNWAFMVNTCRGVYLPEEDIAYWANIPSLGALDDNLYKEL